MDLQDLKRWHWAVAGLVIGLALSYMYDGWDPSGQVPSVGIGTVQRDLLRVARGADRDLPLIRNIRLFPPVVENGVERWYMQLEMIDPVQRAYVRYEVKSIPTPFKVERPNNTEFARNQEVENVRVYLDAVAAANDGFSYTYLWWRERPWIYTFWTGGAVLLVGGVWPTVLSVLVGAGFGRPPREKEEYDLSRFGKGKSEASAQPAAPAVDAEELEAVTRAYEAGLAGEGEGEAMPAEADAETAGSPPEIRKLTITPLEEAPPILKPPEEEKEYVGEFYPVARPAHKKSDE